MATKPQDKPPVKHIAPLASEETKYKVESPGMHVPPPREGYRPGDSLMQGSDDGMSLDQIDDLHYLMLNSVHEEMSTMREEIFRDVFLPVLAGKKQDRELFGQYIHGAGGISRRVRVIDDHGNVLFEVPPLLTTSHIAAIPSNPNAPTFHTILEHTKMLAKISPTQSKNMFERNMYARVREGNRPHENPTHTKEWNVIFARYGYNENTPNASSSSTPDQPGGSATNGPDVDIEDVF